MGHELRVHVLLLNQYIVAGQESCVIADDLLVNCSIPCVVIISLRLQEL